MSGRAIITGRGVVSPAGVGIAPLWASVSSGTSHVGAEKLLDLEDLPIASVSARLPESVLGEVLLRWKESRRSDGEALLWEVVDQALRESGADSRPLPRTTLLTTQLFETGFESSTPTPAYGAQLRAAGGQEPHAHYEKHAPVLREGVASRLVQDLGERLSTELSVMALQATCATGLRLVCEAARLLQLGRTDRVIVAVVSRPIDAVHIASFARALSLSRWDGIPSAASRPFDQRRSGFVLGEAAGALVLEAAPGKAHEQPPSFASVLGWGLAMSSHHIMRPSLTHMVRVMRQALAASGLTPEEVDLVSAMGSSTQLGDMDEARAIHRVFGAELERIRVCAEKATLGYSVQAAALLELISATCAMQAGVTPPLPHCERQDMDIELPVSAQAEERRVDHVLKHAFGLGGHYGALVLRRPS